MVLFQDAPKRADSKPLILFCCILLSTSFSQLGLSADASRDESPSYRVHAFYYPWYGNPKTDGNYANWNHPVAVRNGPARQFPGGDDIGANYFPSLGCYSVNDPDELIGLTSFNEWHEGTQIEPARPKQVGEYQYLDYAPRATTWYLDRTAHWVGKYEQVKELSGN